MERFLQNLFTASIHGSILIFAVLLLRLVLLKTPKKYICYLWLLAGIRLLLPIEIRSDLSLQPEFTLSFAKISSLKWAAVLPWVWAVIAACFAIYSLISYLKLKNQVRDAIRIRGGWESDKIETAFILGFIKPKIYIPMGMDSQSRQNILAHERTHLDKGDHWIKLIGFLALALHWYNPLVWLAAAKGSDDLELSCDEVVLAGQDERRRRDYAHLLLQSAAEGRGFTTCLSARGKSLRYRLENVLKPRKRRSGTVLLAGVTLAVFLSWGSCAVSTRQGTLGEMAFPQGWESMEIQICLESSDLSRRDCQSPEKLLAYLAALPAEELEILGQVADNEDPQLCLTFGEYWEYYTVTGRAAQQRYVNGGQKNTAWVLSSPLDWETVEGYFPAP